jgi:hypothetical protein
MSAVIGKLAVDLNPANDATPISVFQVAPAARQIFDRRSLFARRCSAYMRTVVRSVPNKF